MADCRQKGMRLIFKAPITRVQDIAVYKSGPGLLTVDLDGLLLSVAETELLFYCDGFRVEDQPMITRDVFRKKRFPATELAAMFWKQLDKGPFNGYLIHWDFDKRVSRREAA